MFIKTLETKQIQALTNVRKGEVKLGECVNLPSSADLPQLKSFLKQGAKFCVVGISECIGVLGNHGNPGTENAWTAFLNSFLNVQSNRFLSGNEFVLLGEIDVSDLQAQAMGEKRDSDYFLQKMHVICEELDARVSPVIEMIAEAGLIPIVIGGGHNNAYPILKGVSEGLCVEKGINCINLDAHADFRSLEGRHSGNGFSYAKHNGFLNQYFVFGLHQSYNSESMLKSMDTTDNVDYQFLEDITYLDQDLSKAFDFVLDAGVPCGIELDMDVIRMMPSSAISPTGFSVEQARQFVRKAGRALKTAYLHLPEAAPKTPEESKVIGKALSYLVCDFAKCSA